MINYNTNLGNPTVTDPLDRAKQIKAMTQDLESQRSGLLRGPNTLGSRHQAAVKDQFNQFKPLDEAAPNPYANKPIDAMSATNAAMMGSQSGMFDNTTFKGETLSPKASAALGAGTMAASAVGSSLERSGREGAGGIAKGAATGAMIGSMVPIPVVGTIAGAAIGAIIGGIRGRQAKQTRLAAEDYAERSRLDFNRKRDELESEMMGRAQDYDSTDRLMSAAQNYDSRGNFRMRSGGLLLR